ncbi:hypothetical protein LCGC14_2857700, partial [marine sediment metagenome]
SNISEFWVNKMNNKKGIPPKGLESIVIAIFSGLKLFFAKSRIDALAMV